MLLFVMLFVTLFVTYYSCVPYVPHPENDELLHAALGIYRRFNQYADALLVAIQLNNVTIIREVYDSCPDPYVYINSLTFCASFYTY